MSTMKKRPKAALAGLEARLRAGRRVGVPLPDADMRAMFAAIDADYAKEGCDNTLRALHRWCDAHGHAFGAIAAWCENHGGYCDCEVPMNAQPRFLGWDGEPHSWPVPSN
jgi:hypothetical protein